ncbi:MAG: ligase-associated DNA damage response DEXH box helicase [Cytophagales bacterium]|nr:ligase-associated DNA damage response DEXH box helicase [Bernardetiaceae bacterium]MDW8205306.1 ligase-associated DNA damage response DEXH box helicase [Cytophagales bacterium]
MNATALHPHIAQWFDSKGWQIQPFQQACMDAFLAGQSGLLNAPTGSGKTYALWLPCLAEYLHQGGSAGADAKPPGRLQVLWITPLRALSKDLQLAMQRACDEMQIPWRVALRTGDTSAAERQKQRKNAPECMVTTPESLHLFFATKDHAAFFSDLKAIVIDEWHELMGTKRGVQMELAVAHLLRLQPKARLWGISATIGNLQEAAETLTFPLKKQKPDFEPCIIRANIRKEIEVISILPDTVEKFPWAGHLGINLLHKVLPIIKQSKTTLLFTNTRSQTEIWYQKLLEAAPELAGLIAMHHGSLDNEIRTWVEEALHAEKLKVVVCTSSLDLGVDFRPVDTVIQVGSPKGVGRFMQRAGRSGHRPGDVSRIYFLPTHSLELIEGCALRHAVRHEVIEERPPLQKCYDVLVQYMVTLAVADGFRPDELFDEISATHAFHQLTKQEWEWALSFITTGGAGLAQYDEFKKVEPDEQGIYKVRSRRIAMLHRLGIGTIVSDPVIRVQYVGGGFIGTVEESFISRLKEGDTFWFAGRSLAFVRLKDMVAQVRKSNKKTGQMPRWGGGRVPLSSSLSVLLRDKMQGWEQSREIEMQTIRPVLELQQRWSLVPRSNELLIEYLQTQEGYHLFVYPFEGRWVHEVLAAVIAYRLMVRQPITFSIAMNDYGFELLSDQSFDIEESLAEDLFTTENLHDDIRAGTNQTEMARRKFRDIGVIGGLIFQGYPGKNITFKHLQASSKLLFDVLEEYEPDNLLVQQAYNEVVNIQLDFKRLEAALQRIKRQKIVLKYPKNPTPFAFPILVDRLREQVSSETLEERIGRMTLRLEDIAAGF